VSGTATGDDDHATARCGGTREAPARDLHVGEALPIVSGVGEIETVGRGGRRGVPKGVAAGVEARTAEDVEVAADGEGGEVGEAVELRRAGERREGPPGGGGGGVEKDRRGEGGVRGEEAEEVSAREAEAAAEREQRSRGEEQAPRAGGGAEAGLVGEGEQAEDDGRDVVREPWDQRRRRHRRARAQG